MCKKNFTHFYTLKNLIFNLLVNKLAKYWDKSNFGSMDQLAQSAQFYFLKDDLN